MQNENYLKIEFEKLLREDESLFDFIRSHLFDGIWYWDLENPENEWMHERFWNSLGYTPNEMPNKTSAWEKHIYPEDLRLANMKLREFLQNPHNAFAQTIRYIHKKGYAVWIRFYGKAIRDKNGKALRVIGAHQNIGVVKNTKEIKRAKKEAEQISQNLKRVQEITHTGSWHLNVKTNEVQWTEELFKMFGFDPNLPPPPFSEHWKLFTPKSWDLLSSAITKTRELGIPYQIELKTLKKDGSNGWIWVSGEAMRNGNNEIVSLWGAMQDITERKQLELELQAAKKKAEFNEQKFKAAYYTSPDAVNINTLDGTFVDVNLGFTEMFGFSRREVIGKKSLGIHIWQFPEHRESLLKTLKEKGKIENLESVFRCKDGTLKTALMSASIISINNEPHILSVTRDISERKKHEEKLKQQKEKAEQKEKELKKAQKTAKVGSWIWYVRENRLWWSDEMYHIFEIDKKNFTGKLRDVIANSIHPADRAKVEASNRSVIENNKPIPVEYRIITVKDTIKFVYGLADEIVLDEDGKSKILRGIVKDITEYKQIEQELILAKEKIEESDRLKTGFLNNLSHELRTPMNGIMGFSELLISQKISKQQQELYVDQIKISCDQLLDIVTDAIEMSKIQNNLCELDPVKFPFVDFIDELLCTIGPKISTKKLHFNLSKECIENNLELYCDYDKLYKALKHILDNAIKFTNEGSITLECSSDTQNLIISVSDTGIGIPPEYTKKIFEPFYQIDYSMTRGYGGNGVGLSIAKSHIEKMGGEIWLLSEKNKGTTVKFSIPVKTSNEPVALKQQNKGSDRDVSDKTILVVDDENSLHIFYNEILTQKGVKILCAENGMEAIEIYEQSSGIDMVIMDIKMPEMDGFEATKRIRDMGCKAPIVALTAFVDRDKRKLNLEHGFNAYLAKPVSPKRLMETVQKHLLNKD